MLPSVSPSSLDIRIVPKTTKTINALFVTNSLMIEKQSKIHPNYQ